MSIPILITVVAGLTSILTALATAAINYLFSERSKNRDREIAERYKQIDRDTNERTRQLDLYKVVYPEKVKTAAALMQQADTLFQTARFAVTAGKRDDEELKANVLKSATRLHERSTGAEWLLGTEVRALGIQLVVAARCIYTCQPDNLDQLDDDWLSTEKHEGGNGKYHACHAALGQSIRQQLHLGTLEALLLTGSQTDAKTTTAITDATNTKTLPPKSRCQ